MFENLVEILKKNPRKIVYTEGTDARILESAARLKAGGFLTPVLVGNVDEVKAAAAKGGFDIEGLEIVDPENYAEFDAMVDEEVKLRRGQRRAEDCAALHGQGTRLFVTPDGIDRQIRELSALLAQAVSLALQPGLTLAEVEALLA